MCARACVRLGGVQQYENLSADCVSSSCWPSQQTVACLIPSSLCQSNIIARSSDKKKKKDFLLWLFWGEKEKKRGWKKRIPDVFASATSSRRSPSKPTPTYLPTRELPASDKGSSRQNQVWREGVWRKRVELERGRRDTEGGEKVRDTGGFIALPEIRRVSTQTVWQTKPRRRSEINQQPPLHHLHFLREDYFGFWNIYDFFQRHFFFRFGEVQATQSWVLDRA